MFSFRALLLLGIFLQTNLCLSHTPQFRRCTKGTKTLESTNDSMVWYIRNKHLCDIIVSGPPNSDQNLSVVVPNKKFNWVDVTCIQGSTSTPGTIEAVKPKKCEPWSQTKYYERKIDFGFPASDCDRIVLRQTSTKRFGIALTGKETIELETILNYPMMVMLLAGDWWENKYTFIVFLVLGLPAAFLMLFLLESCFLESQAPNSVKLFLFGALSFYLGGAFFTIYRGSANCGAEDSIIWFLGIAGGAFLLPVFWILVFYLFWPSDAKSQRLTSFVLCLFSIGTVFLLGGGLWGGALLQFFASVAGFTSIKVEPLPPAPCVAQTATSTYFDDHHFSPPPPPPPPLMQESNV